LRKMIVSSVTGDSCAQSLCSVLRLSRNKGALMARNFGLVAKAKALYGPDIETQSDRRELIVTVLGTSLAVLIVGAIAVLMGMA
jgi:hypothetical protein